MTTGSASYDVPEFLQRLGLVPPCSVEDVKQAYRIKVKSVHPDAGGSVSEFNAVQEAFERALEYARFRRANGLAEQSRRAILRPAGVTGRIAQQGIVAQLEQVNWLKRSFGADFAQLVEKIIGLSVCGPKYADDTVAYLLSERTALQHLHWLDLSNSRVTDRGVRMLAMFEHLQRLDLRGTQATDQCLPLIERLPKLEWLGLPRRIDGVWLRWRLRRNFPDLRLAQEGESCQPQPAPA